LTFFFLADPATVWVTLGSFDDPNSLRPSEHWYVDDKLCWIDLHDDLPKWRAAPPE
jgi:hypothetical protein